MCSMTRESTTSVVVEPPRPSTNATELELLSSGISTPEAASRLATDGPNQLPQARRAPLWKKFASQLVHFFALMLWVAGILSFVAGMPQLGVAIFVVVLVNGTFAFAQEFRAERAVARLRDLLPRHATVVRDGD